MEQKDHFDKVFWFCVGIEAAGFLMLAALIWIPVPKENQSIANIAIGFITATVIAIPLQYLLGGNPNQQKKSAEPGTATVELSATATTEKKEP